MFTYTTTRSIIFFIYYKIIMNRAVDQLHQACTFIRTENIAVNEIGRIICSHILLHAL